MSRNLQWRWRERTMCQGASMWDAMWSFAISATPKGVMDVNEPKPGCHTDSTLQLANKGSWTSSTRLKRADAELKLWKAEKRSISWPITRRRRRKRGLVSSPMVGPTSQPSSWPQKRRWMPSLGHWKRWLQVAKGATVQVEMDQLWQGQRPFLMRLMILRWRWFQMRWRQTMWWSGLLWTLGHCSKFPTMLTSRMQSKRPAWWRQRSCSWMRMFLCGGC